MAFMTLSEASGSQAVPLLRETIGANLARTVARFGDREALVSVQQDIRWTYDEYAHEIDQVARGLLGLGFAKGDRVGIWSPNNAEWALLQYATSRLGIIMVNINPAYRTHELAYALEQSGCRGLVAVPTFKTSDYGAMVTELRPTLPDLEHVIFIGTNDWTELLAAGEGISPDDVAAVEASLHPDDPISIQYTSGTTGRPKGATLTHANILNNGFFVGEGCKYTEHDRIAVPVPLYHCFGMVMGNLAATTHGACVVYPADAFDPEATLKAVADERCTSLYGVPTMFIAELASPDFDAYDLSSLRTGIMAGSPCPIEVMKQAIERMNMDEVTIAYGMTETSPVSTQTATDDPIDKRVGTVGRVAPHVQVKIVDPETGETVERGVTGEFTTWGYSVMDGYWNDPEKTAGAIDAEGWMHTGDLATMDADGYLNIVGRTKDMVIRGGENVYPREVEEFLYSHPRIRDVQVIGVPDRKYGEELLAWVQTDDGTELSAAEVREFCVGQIAHFKIPRYVAVIEEFPMTVTGKIQKFILRDMAIEKFGLESHVVETA
jgi:fatty-acyl-CoA synthase